MRGSPCPSLRTVGKAGGPQLALDLMGTEVTHVFPDCHPAEILLPSSQRASPTANPCL